MFLLLIITLTHAFIPPPVNESLDRSMYSVNLKSGPSSVFDVLDPNNTQWKSKGIDTEQDINDFFILAKKWNNQYFGLNWSLAVHNPINDVYELFRNATLIARLLPYKLNSVNKTYRVHYDSKYLGHSPEKWYRENYGFLTQMVGTGNFTSGRANGTQWHDGDVIGVNVFYIFRESKNWTEGNSFERITAFSVVPSEKFINGQGIEERVVKQLVLDKRNNLGAELTTVQTVNDPVLGLQTVTSTMITFPPWIAPHDIEQSFDQLFNH